MEDSDSSRYLAAIQETDRSDKDSDLLCWGQRTNETASHASVRAPTNLTYLA